MQCTVHGGLVRWRSAVWKPLYSDANNSQIVNMTFTKSRSDTYLRLTWSSNMRQLINDKCSQWYFMMNGHGVRFTTNQSMPTYINKLIYPAIANLPTFTAMEPLSGCVKATSSGPLQAASYLISMNVRDCPGVGRFRGSDAYTGWASPSTMIVEELCPPNST